MKSIILSVAITLLSIHSSFSQISHDLEIYSENGLNFTLIINGRTMNETPVSNIQVVNTDKDYLNAKIVFEDPNIPEIEKKMLQLADPAETSSKSPVSVVYKIVETKKGEQVMRFASRSHKKIQTTDVILIESNPQPVNGKIVISW